MTNNLHGIEKRKKVLKQWGRCKFCKRIFTPQEIEYLIIKKCINCDVNFDECLDFYYPVKNEQN